jgi:hypothetical protein
MYNKIASTIGALGNLEIKAITLGRIYVFMSANRGLFQKTLSKGTYLFLIMINM